MESDTVCIARPEIGITISRWLQFEFATNRNGWIIDAPDIF
jgi:hypothetical protein